MKRSLRGDLLLLFLFNLSSIFNYIFQLVVGRSLPPEAFGSFNALNSLSIMIAAPAAAIPLVVARYTVKFDLQGHGMVRSLLRRGLLWLSAVAAIMFLLGMAANPFIRRFLQEDATGPVSLMLANMCLGIVLPLPTGILQGLQRFTGYALSGLNQTLGRLLFGILLVPCLAYGLVGALWAGVFGTAVALAMSFLFLQDMVRGPALPLPAGVLGEMSRYSVPALLTTILGLVLGNIDIVLVRHYTSPVESGLYATAALLGRIALFGPSLLASMLFPDVAKCQETGRSAGKTLWSTLGCTVLLACGFALACFLYPELIIHMFFGDGYTAAAPLLRVVSLAMALLCVAQVFFTYGLARFNYGYIWCLAGGVLAFLVLIGMFHGSSLEIAISLLLSIALILVCTLAWFFLTHRGKPERADGVFAQLPER